MAGVCLLPKCNRLMSQWPARIGLPEHELFERGLGKAIPKMGSSRTAFQLRISLEIGTNFKGALRGVKNLRSTAI